MKPRLKRAPRPRVCDRCGGALIQQIVDKYDKFWTTFLIWIGALLAFYLVGILLMFQGLWLRGRKKIQWVCPACA